MKVKWVFAFLVAAGAFAAIMVFLFPFFLFAYLVMAVCVGLPLGIYAGLKEHLAAKNHSGEGGHRMIETRDRALPPPGVPYAGSELVAVERAPEEDDAWTEVTASPSSNPFLDYLLDTLRNKGDGGN